jgi:Aspartyl/Asparaginyl beta-hydroxylase
MLGLETAIRIPFTFDTELLNRDLAKSERFEYSTHPLRYHDGSWRTINLVYSGGSATYTHEGAFGYGDEAPRPTPVLNECPYFREVIETFGAPVKMARLSALPPGGRIHRHYDPIESIDFDCLRVHIPIRSDPDLVRFYLAFRRRRWRSGEAWYGDFTFPHSVHNRADFTRVNMIVDFEMTERARAWFPEAYLSDAAVTRRRRYRDEARNLSWRLSKLGFGVAPS